MTPLDSASTGDDSSIDGASPLDQLDFNGSRVSLSSLSSCDSAGGLLAKLKLDESEIEECDSPQLSRPTTRRHAKDNASSTSPNMIAVPASRFRSLRPFLAELQQRRAKESAVHSAAALGNTVSSVHNDTPIVYESSAAADVQSIHITREGSTSSATEDYDQELEREPSLETPVSQKSDLFSSVSRTETGLTERTSKRSSQGSEATTATTITARLSAGTADSAASDSVAPLGTIAELQRPLFETRTMSSPNMVCREPVREQPVYSNQRIFLRDQIQPTGYEEPRSAGLVENTRRSISDPYNESPERLYPRSATELNFASPGTTTPTPSSSTSMGGPQPPRGLTHQHTFSNPFDVTQLHSQPVRGGPGSPLAKKFHHKFYHATAPSPVTVTPPSPQNDRYRQSSTSSASSSDASLAPLRAKAVIDNVRMHQRGDSLTPSRSGSGNDLGTAAPPTYPYEHRRVPSSPGHAYRALVAHTPTSVSAASSATDLSDLSGNGLAPPPSPLFHNPIPGQSHLRHPSQELPRPPPPGYTHSRSCSTHSLSSAGIQGTPAVHNIQQPAPAVAPADTSVASSAPASSYLTPESRVSMAIALRKSGQSKEAAYQLQVAAQEGNQKGMFLYGLSLRYGYGVRKDERQSFLWICRSAGIMPDTPYTFDVNPKQILMEMSGPLMPEEPLSSIYFEIGQAYLHGWGCAIDLPQSVEFFELSGSLGYTDAMCEAGRMWTSKKLNGGRKDVPRAASWFRLAERCGAKLLGSDWIHKSKYD